MVLFLKGALCLHSSLGGAFLGCHSLPSKARVSTCSKNEVSSDTGKGTVQMNAKFTRQLTSGVRDGETPRGRSSCPRPAMNPGLSWVLLGHSDVLRAVRTFLFWKGLSMPQRF